MDIITFYETEEEYEHGNYAGESSMVQYAYNREKKEIRYKRNSMGGVIYVRDYKRAEVFHSEYGFTHIRVVLEGNYEERE